MSENLELNKFLSKYSRTPNGRVDFSKSPSNVLLPNLCEVQFNSFKWFVEKGINEVFNDVFPIASDVYSRGRRIVEADQILKLEYVGSEWKEPKKDYFECKLSNIIYNAPLYCKLRLTISGGNIIEDIFIWVISLG